MEIGSAENELAVVGKNELYSPQDEVKKMPQRSLFLYSQLISDLSPNSKSHKSVEISIMASIQEWLYEERHMCLAIGMGMLFVFLAQGFFKNCDGFVTSCPPSVEYRPAGVFFGVSSLFITWTAEKVMFVYPYIIYVAHSTSPALERKRYYVLALVYGIIGSIARYTLFYATDKIQYPLMAWMLNIMTQMLILAGYSYYHLRLDVQSGAQLQFTFRPKAILTFLIATCTTLMLISFVWQPKPPFDTIVGIIHAVDIILILSTFVPHVLSIYWTKCKKCCKCCECCQPQASVVVMMSVSTPTTPASDCELETSSPDDDKETLPLSHDFATLMFISVFAPIFLFLMVIGFVILIPLQNISVVELGLRYTGFMIVVKIVKTLYKQACRFALWERDWVYAMLPLSWCEDIIDAFLVFRLGDIQTGNINWLNFFAVTIFEALKNFVRDTSCFNDFLNLYCCGKKFSLSKRNLNNLEVTIGIAEIDYFTEGAAKYFLFWWLLSEVFFEHVVGFRSVLFVDLFKRSGFSNMDGGSVVLFIAVSTAAHVLTVVAAKRYLSKRRLAVLSKIAVKSVESPKDFEKCKKMFDRYFFITIAQDGGAGTIFAKELWEKHWIFAMCVVVSGIRFIYSLVGGRL